MHHQTSRLVQFMINLLKYISIKINKTNPNFFDGLNPCRLGLSNSGSGRAHPKEWKL